MRTGEEAWTDNIKTWTGLTVEESIRMTEDRDKWRKYITSMVWPTVGSRMAKEQNILVSYGTQNIKIDLKTQSHN